MPLTRAPLLPALLLLGACSDYAVDAIDKGSEGGGTTATTPDTGTTPAGSPDLLADPTLVELGTICGQASPEVILTNQGDADLTISALSLSGDGWTLIPADLPLVLTPGEDYWVALFSEGGEAVLTVECDDPISPLWEIPLSAVADAAPLVEITSPSDGEILGAGLVSTFLADVSDDADIPSELSAEWSSDVDGVVSTELPGADGVASFDWTASAVSSGTHTVTLKVTDTCGNFASDSVTLCQNEGYVEDSVDLATWHFEGSAQWDSANSWVQLTTPTQNQAGTAFQTSATVDADNVSIEFAFYVSGGSGADGISLTALDTTRMTTYVGGAGGGIGYMGLPGWSVEVDTYFNDGADPTSADHVSVHLDGDYYSPVAWAALPEMEDNNWHQMSVTVSGTWMTVTIDGTTWLDQTISGLTAFPAYVGFTGATGSLTNDHLIDALEVEKFVCED